MPRVEVVYAKFRMFAKALVSLRVVSLAVIATLIFVAFVQNSGKPAVPKPPQTTPIEAAQVPKQFLYTFNVDGILEEAAPMSETKSPYWWLNSGGELLIQDGVGETIQGDLPQSDPWYAEYHDTNAEDTDGGIHPQNLLRLVSRSTWENVRLESSYYIAKDNLSSSPNRNESNGLLLMSRYTDDGQTLYYAGIRVDGSAVIKKKYKGTYYTMAQQQIFPGTYSIEAKPKTSQNLLPHNQWLRLASETTTRNNGSVSIKLYMQDASTKKWKLLLTADDTSQYENTPPIIGEHFIGLRTDFMDVKFDDILMEKL